MQFIGLSFLTDINLGFFWDFQHCDRLSLLFLKNWPITSLLHILVTLWYLVVTTRWYILRKPASDSYRSAYPANIYMFKANNRNHRKGCGICSKLTAKKAEQRQWTLSGFFIVNFEHISHLFIMFVLLTLTKYLFSG